MRADGIVWDEPSKNWRLEYAVDRKVQPLKEEVSMNYNQKMKFNFKPYDLSRDKYTKDKLTTPD
ncbi:hypothetical protein, partial [Stenotrophomonas maltophilia]|uniref:hypothetical protein n=1 Tax=Stenotrophomonas maltophilia TaxID=40324 RepID=UPI001954CD56